MPDRGAQWARRCLLLGVCRSVRGSETGSGKRWVSRSRPGGGGGAGAAPPNPPPTLSRPIMPSSPGPPNPGCPRPGRPSPLSICPRHRPSCSLPPSPRPTSCTPRCCYPNNFTLLPPPRPQSSAPHRSPALPAEYGLTARCLGYFSESLRSRPETRLLRRLLVTISMWETTRHRVLPTLSAGPVPKACEPGGCAERSSRSVRVLEYSGQAWGASPSQAGVKAPRPGAFLVGRVFPRLPRPEWVWGGPAVSSLSVVTRCVSQEFEFIGTLTSVSPAAGPRLSIWAGPCFSAGASFINVFNDPRPADSTHGSPPIPFPSPPGSAASDSASRGPQVGAPFVAGVLAF